jgi:hypothetical protein
MAHNVDQADDELVGGERLATVSEGGGELLLFTQAHRCRVGSDEGTVEVGLLAVLRVLVRQLTDLDELNVCDAERECTRPRVAQTSGRAQRTDIT